MDSPSDVEMEKIDRAPALILDQSLSSLLGKSTDQQRLPELPLERCAQSTNPSLESKSLLDLRNLAARSSVLEGLPFSPTRADERLLPNTARVDERLPLFPSPKPITRDASVVPVSGAKPGDTSVPIFTGGDRPLFPWRRNNPPREEIVPGLPVPAGSDRPRPVPRSNDLVPVFPAPKPTTTDARVVPVLPAKPAEIERPAWAGPTPGARTDAPRSRRDEVDPRIDRVRPSPAVERTEYLDSAGTVRGTRDRLNRLTSITYPDGRIKQFDYNGETREIISMKVRDGQSWQHTTKIMNSDNWLFTDNRGQTRMLTTRIELNDNGVLSIQSRAPRGNSPWRTMVFDQRGEISKVTVGNGSTRSFHRAVDGALLSIEDQINRPGLPPRREVWNRSASDATCFEKVLPNGRVEVRRNLLIGNDGNYSFRNAENKMRRSCIRDVSPLRIEPQPERIEPRRERIEPPLRRGGREFLENVAREKLTPPDYENLRKYMDKFEQRCRDGKQNGFKVPSVQQIERTYAKLAEVLNPEKPGPMCLSQERRSQAVLAALFNIAQPAKINQGNNPTCNVTTGERRIATLHPERYASLIADITLKGEFRCVDGSVVRPLQAALSPKKQEKASVRDLEYAAENDLRNSASKIVQVTMISMLRPGYNGGSPNFGVNEILAATYKVTGRMMPYITNLVNDRQLSALKEQGDFPCGIRVLSKRGRSHVVTIDDVATRSDGVLLVKIQDQHGVNRGLTGWYTVAALHQIQNTPNRNQPPRTQPPHHPHRHNHPHRSHPRILRRR